MAHIRIVKDSQVRPWHFQDPDTKEVFTDSTFQLRTVPDNVEKQIRRKFTTYDRDRTGRHEVLDVRGYVNEACDYAITAWSGVHDSETNQALACEFDNKRQLPEVVKAAIIRYSVGREIEDIAREVSGESASDQGYQDPNRTSGSGSNGGKTMPESRPVAVS